MTTFGTTIKIDPVGRCVIPKPLRDMLQIQGHDVLEVLITEEGILIRKPAFEIRKKQ